MFAACLVKELRRVWFFFVVALNNVFTVVKKYFDVRTVFSRDESTKKKLGLVGLFKALNC